MSARNPRLSSIREIAGFWGLVVVVSLVMAAMAFAAGKYWVGGLIAGGTPATPRIEVKSPDQAVAPPADGEEGMTEPPPKALVKSEQRQPTEAEKGELEQKYPQDGAALPGEGGADASKGGDSKALDGSDGTGSYTVKAGSYLDPDNAQRHADELAAKGYATEIVSIEVKGKTYHRVVVGPYTDQSEAERVRDELNAAGYEASVKSR